MFPKTDADLETVKKIEEAYKKLNGPEEEKCKSLLKKHLTKEVMEKLKTNKRKLVFSDPITEDYHGFKPNQKPLISEKARLESSPSLDPKGKCIKSTRIRCAGLLVGYPLNPCLKEDEYLAMKGKFKKAFTMEGKVKKDFTMKGKVKKTFNTFDG